MPKEALKEQIAERWPASSDPPGGELQFRHLLETLPAGAYTCDPEGVITYYNQHAVQLCRLLMFINRVVTSFALLTFLASLYFVQHLFCAYILL